MTPQEARESNPDQNPSHFYKNECFLSTISDKNPLLSIVGKSAVMELSDYQTQRPTQFAEADVYVCESVYDEINKRVVKGQMPDGLKTYQHASAVQTDEVFFFKNPIVAQKVGERERCCHS